MNSIQKFNTDSFINALKAFFAELNVPVNYFGDLPAAPANILGEKYNPDNATHQLISDIYVLGMVDDAAFDNDSTGRDVACNISAITADYDGILIFGVTLKTAQPTRTLLADITRLLNRAFPYTPVTVVFRYNHHIALSNTERTQYCQEWREGEKVGKVTMLRDIDVEKPNAAHLKILFGDKNSKGLQIDINTIHTFKKLYAYWQSVFSLQSLNDHFYGDLQDWFYYAAQNIKLPFKPDYINEKENIKNFLVRLLSRTLFCWFVKEKGLIHKELFELTDWEGNRYKLTDDVTEPDFLQRNSYYRGILQNVFFNALSQKDKKSLKDFKWTKYLHKDFNLELFTQIPYLNGGIFDELKIEDNAKESIEDSVISIPNYLFYGIETEDVVAKGKGGKATQEIQKVEHKGLNGILKSYKFTLDENTPYEEDIALDPEMLGLVFENLLAELDPNLEENTIKSIRKLTGSYYTPRKIIYEMVNDSLFHYLSKFVETDYPNIPESKKSVTQLVYFNTFDASDKKLSEAIVKGLDKFKMLDPACGSGAFPMGMLHRMVDILKLVDPHNELWIELKLNNVDSAQRADFKKVLTAHLDDYGRKLGIIRDSIYGIDIQPLAVQITKLRFFISLLIDQKTDKGITPMPNIETKIICADSLKNIQADVFSYAYIEQLSEARNRYYQPDISHEEREKIANDIIEILDAAFPHFAQQITGKNTSGQNKSLLRDWFIHSTLAAPFFNMDFFYPELKDYGGFDCVIGNPPYGGFKISDEVRATLMIESKDPYGAFIARFLSNIETPTPLKHGGVLAFIVSDTFMTIKSHLKLRRLMMQNYVHKMVRVHPDTFRATVNTVVMIAERNTQKEFDNHHVCLMADMTNVSIHENYDRFVEILNQTKMVNTAPDISTPEYAIYRYPQSLIRTNSNLPFFVASPKLFALMNDGNDPNNKPMKQIKEIGGKQVEVRSIEMNGKKIEVVKLGDIAENLGGVKTYDNVSYIKSTKSTGSYVQINKDEIVLEISEKEKKFGIENNRIRKYVPFDKSGDMISGDGRIINYLKPVEFYIDWSIDAIKYYTENNGLRNKHRYFQEGITYSVTGVYAPTYRIGTGFVFGQKGATIFTDILSKEYLLSILCSRLNRFVVKNFLSHGVDATDSIIAELVLVINSKIVNSAELIAKSILSKLNFNFDYNYENNEQIEIDKLVYEAYGLNADDVKEVENWYARRYGKLSAAQKANLRALGKSDNYLELYGMR
jgi:hypothetical protein